MRPRIAMWILWIAVPPGFVLLFAFLIPGLEKQTTRAGASRFVDVLETLPTQWIFYALVLGLVGAWIARHRQICDDLHNQFTCRQSSEDGRALSAHDWWVLERFRKRALDLRLRADLTLTGVFALLFTGLYFAIFVPPEINVRDRTAAKQIQERQFKEKFGNQLDAMVDGRYWLKTNDKKLIESADETRTRLDDNGQQGVLFTTADGGATWSSPRRLTGFKRGEQVWWFFSANGRIGLIRGHEGSVFITTDGGKTWKPSQWKLSAGERITGATFSADGRTGLVAGDAGPLFITTNGGETWKPSELNLADGERIIGVAFSADGGTGLIVSNKGSVFTTTDGGRAWNPSGLNLRDGETVADKAFSADGRTGLIVSDKGSVFTTMDGGKKWHPSELNLAEREMVIGAAFSASDGNGLIVSNKGSVFTTTDGGKTWNTSKMNLADNERIDEAAFSATGRTGLVVSLKGSVFTTTDGGNTWHPSELNLADREWVVDLALSANGQAGLVVSNKGSEFTTMDGGKTWSASDLNLAHDEAVTVVRLSADGQTGLVAGIGGSIFMQMGKNQSWNRQSVRLTDGERPTVAAFSAGDQTCAGQRRHPQQRGWTRVVGGDQGSVFITTDGGETWSRGELTLADGERVVSAALSANGGTGLIGGDQGSVFITTDCGQTWNPGELKLADGERVVGAALSADGRTSLIVSNFKSALFTQDNGMKWTFTKLFGELLPSAPTSSRRSDFPDSLTSYSDGFLAESADVYYVLTSYPELRGWSDWSLEHIHTVMNRDETLRNSPVFLDLVTSYPIGAGYGGGETTGGEAPIGDAKGKESNVTPSDGQGSFTEFLGDFTVIRIVILTVVFFLAQVLIRLYQYCLRMSEFWDSRADAVLLKHSFADHKSKNFDTLVNALSPDTYDFKPPPRTPLQGLMSRRQDSAS